MLPLVPHMEIAHHIPGRIRLGFLLSGLRAIQRVDIKTLVLGIPGVLGLRINPSARSVVIEYNQEHIPHDFWQLLEQLKRRPETLAEVATRIRYL